MEKVSAMTGFILIITILFTGCGASVKTQDAVLPVIAPDTAETIAAQMVAMPRPDGYMRSVIRSGDKVFHIAADGIVIRSENAAPASELIVESDGISGMFLSDEDLYFAVRNGEAVQIRRINTTGELYKTELYQTDIVWDSTWPNEKTGMGRHGAGENMIENFCVKGDRLFVLANGIWLGEVNLNDNTAIYLAKGSCFAIPDEDLYISGYTDELNYSVGRQDEKQSGTPIDGAEYDITDISHRQDSYVGFGDSIYSITADGNIIWKFSKDAVYKRIEIPELTSGSPNQDICLFYCDDTGRLWLLRCAHPEYKLYLMSKDVTGAELIKTFSTDIPVQSYMIIDDNIFLSMNSGYNNSWDFDYAAEKVITMSLND